MNDPLSKESPNERVAYEVKEILGLVPLSKNAVYKALEDGTIPSIRVGRIYLIPKGPFHRMFDGKNTE